MNKDPKIAPLNVLFENSIVNHWGQAAMSNYKERTLTYKDVAQGIHRIHELFKQAGVERGDKIALLGRNSANWCVIYLATISYGAVIVPILPDFTTESTQHIINHSDSVFIFTSKSFLEKINLQNIPQCKGVIAIEANTTFHDGTGEIAACVGELKNKSINKEQFHLPVLDDELPAVISYTSGTSGFSKGVVVPLRSITSNVHYGLDHIRLKSGNSILSFLPLAHSFGCLFDFLMPIARGCHITYLSKMPTPAVVMAALQDIKPHFTISVPLVIEKIYSRRIQPIIEKPLMRMLLKTPGINTLILKKMRSKLLQAFGGNIYEVGIGGAPLNKAVEDFFIKMKFPFAMGYGMTECGPVIAYAPFDEHRRRSTGKIVDRMECKINSSDAEHVDGEIMVRGANLMLGYYKDEKTTQEAFQDGWLKTGDLGVLDKDGYVYIRGRNKSLILSASGQNIYPEEIETIINSEPIVQECLVRDNDGKLEALIFPDFELVETKTLTYEELLKKTMELKNKLNKTLPNYSQIATITVVDVEFEKTPKRSIKRYLYSIKK